MYFQLSSFYAQLSVDCFLEWNHEHAYPISVFFIKMSPHILCVCGGEGGVSYAISIDLNS